MDEILAREETHDWIVDALSRERKGGNTLILVAEKRGDGKAVLGK